MTIKSGYLLKITTWENDADAYATVDTDGLTADEVKFLIAVAKLFYSEHGWGPRKGLYGNSNTGNMASIVESIKEIIDLHERLGSDLTPWKYTLKDNDDLGDFEAYEEDFYQEMLSTIGIKTWADGEYWRVFESFKVIHVPVELRDVTHRFH